MDAQKAAIKGMGDVYERPQLDPSKLAGYTFDPYADPSQLVDIHSPNIPFHDYRQIHIGEVAFEAGFAAVTMADAKCPPLWQDSGHYWAACALAGYLTSEFLTKEGALNKVVTILGAGGLFVVLKPILATYGIII